MFKKFYIMSVTLLLLSETRIRAKTNLPKGFREVLHHTLYAFKPTEAGWRPRQLYYLLFPPAK
jgi:hypothetical protein